MWWGDTNQQNPVHPIKVTLGKELKNLRFVKHIILQKHLALKFYSSLFKVSLYQQQFFSIFFSIRCFIPNAYAALFTAALVPLMCLVVVFVVFIHAYQVTPQWKAYDDIFRGRTNAAGKIRWLVLCKQVELSEWYWLFSPVQKTPLETTLQ